MMKVAMIARSTLYTASGGDTVQAIQTANMLLRQGVQVDIKLTHEKINYSQYQLLHFFNIARPADILFHIRNSSLPFAISTIYINYSEYDRNFRSGFTGALFRLFSANTIEYLKAVAKWILRKDKLVTFSYLWIGHKKSVNFILNKAKYIFPNSYSELSRLSTHFACTCPCLIVPNGIDPSLFSYNRWIKKDETLVLCVARVEGIKNQLNLIRALNNSKYKLVIIGSAAPNQASYYKRCRKIAATNIFFVNHVRQEELVQYYQQAKVHVLPSWFETTGLSSLEAAAMGCNIVITDKGDTRDYFGTDAYYCDPSSPESILESVQEAATSEFSEDLQKKIYQNYTWKQAASCTLEGYKKIISLT